MTNKKTLLLDATMQPLCIISWQKALTLVIQDKCIVIDEYPDTIKSQKQEFQIPSVLRLNSRVKKGSAFVKFSKKNVYLRDKGRCQYCGKRVRIEDATYDHVHPKSKWDSSKGQATQWNNIVIACRECNLKKADKHLHEYSVQLKQQPYRPRVNDIPFALVSIRERELRKGPEVWKYYTTGLSKAYGWDLEE